MEIASKVSPNNIDVNIENLDKKKVLVVDDERGICDSVEKILSTNGFSVLCLNNGREALEEINKKEYNPDYILLDIWMPDVDGNDVIKQIGQLYSNEKKDFKMPYIVAMSGHIDSEASSELIKIGAKAFLEKPFSRDQLLRQLGRFSAGSETNNEKILSQQSLTSYTGKYGHLVAGKNKQKTLLASVVGKGIGIHSGTNTGVILLPMREGSGVVFEDINSAKTVPALINFVDTTNYSTKIKSNGVSIGVVEHLLSALHGYGITNVKIKVSREIPIFDGSALPFCELIEKAGVKEQKENTTVLVVDEKVSFVDDQDESKKISIEPYDGLLIDYRLFVSPEFGEQHFVIDLSENRQQLYKKEISPCRTFGFLSETQKLQGIGMARGANLGNSLLLHENKVINSDLKFANEFARHKILDILGDFYLLNGITLQGKIVASGTGHRHNCQLLKKLISAK